MDISWDNQKCPKNGGIITLRRFWPSADLNEIFSAEKWLKHKYPRFETRTFGYSLDFTDFKRNIFGRKVVET
jgi:hypothetical protein